MQPEPIGTARARSRGHHLLHRDHRGAKQARQQDRIASGAAGGKLTPQETQRLEKQQARVSSAEQAAAADGKVTAKEKKDIRAMQKDSTKTIHRKTDNKKVEN